ELREREIAEEQPENADDDSAHQERASVGPAEADCREIRQHEAGFAALVRCLRRRRLRLRRGGRARRRGERGAQEHTQQNFLNGHNHCPSHVAHKSVDYMRTLGGSAMPPVRTMRMPSSTEISGNTARSRSTITTSPRYRLLVGTYTASSVSGPLPRSTVNSRV